MARHDVHIVHLRTEIAVFLFFLFLYNYHLLDWNSSFKSEFPKPQFYLLRAIRQALMSSQPCDRKMIFHLHNHTIHCFWPTLQQPDTTIMFKTMHSLDNPYGCAQHNSTLKHSLQQQICTRYYQQYLQHSVCRLYDLCPMITAFNA